MSTAKLIVPVFTAWMAVGCGANDDGLDVIKVRTTFDLDEFGDHEGLYQLVLVEPSACVVDRLAEFSDEQLEGWRQSLCDGDANGGAMTCERVTVDGFDNVSAFSFHAPEGHGPDSWFALGPFPTPEASSCDPVVSLIYESPQWAGQASTGSPWQDPVSMRADGSVYSF